MAKLTVDDSPAQAAFRAEVRAFLRTHLPDGWVDAIEAGDDASFDAARMRFDLSAWWALLGDSGYIAPLLPRDYGGLGVGPIEQGIIREELSAHRLPTVSLNLLGVAMAAPTIAEHGTDEQKRRYIAPILRSEEIWCQLFSEPGSGSDLASLSTRAVRDGDEFVVNGQKVWTTLAQFAQFGMLLCRTDPDVPKHEGLTWMILDMRSAGVTVRPLVQMTGGAEFNEVFFEDVRVPVSNVVGAEGDGWRVARTTLMNERTALSGLSLDPVAMMGGTRKDPMEVFLDYARQAGAAADPVARQRVVQIWIEKECKDITSARAQSARKSGSQPGPEGAIAKVFNAEWNRRKTELEMDLGGAGSVADSSLVKWAQRSGPFLRARANTIEGGTSEVLRNQIGERILGLPREPDVDKDIAWKDTRRSS
jgi:alkylation response protein AidB-like acyl-CoA dehydrogenase